MELNEKISLFLETKKKANKEDYGGEDLIDISEKIEKEKNKQQRNGWLEGLNNRDDGLEDDPADNYRSLAEKIEIYNTYLPLELDNMLCEDLSFRENFRLRIIKATLKYVDIDSVRKQFPELENASKRDVIKFLKTRIDQLPDSVKRDLINTHLVKQAELKATGGVVAGRVIGGVTGAASGAGAVAAGTTGASIGSAIAGSTFVGAMTAVLLLPFHLILGIGTLALAAICGLTLGITAISNKNNKRMRATMMSQNEIIEAIKKDKKDLENGKDINP